MLRFFRRANSKPVKDALGEGGERLAADFLKRDGIKILSRNYSCDFGEIDLIGLHRDTIIFFEVKTRRSDEAADPEQSIGAHKQRKLQLVAKHWLAQHKQPNAAYRFDAISVVWPEQGKPEIRHIVEAFVPRR